MCFKLSFCHSVHTKVPLLTTGGGEGEMEGVDGGGLKLGEGP